MIFHVLKCYMSSHVKDPKWTLLQILKGSLFFFLWFQRKDLLTAKRTEKCTEKRTEKRNVFTKFSTELFPNFWCVFFCITTAHATEKQPPKESARKSITAQSEFRVPMWQGWKPLNLLIWEAKRSWKTENVFSLQFCTSLPTNKFNPYWHKYDLTWYMFINIWFLESPFFTRAENWHKFDFAKRRFRMFSDTLHGD